MANLVESMISASGKKHGGWRKSRSAAACALVATLAASGAASATLLNEPPKGFGFKLDDPSSPSLRWLESFHDAELERPGPARLYMSGPWGKWREDPWVSLSWVSDDPPPGPRVEVVRLAEEEESREPPDSASSELSSLLARSFLGLGDELRRPERFLGFLDRFAPAATTPLFSSTGPSFASNGFDTIWAGPPKPIPWWKCRRRPVTFVRHGGENDAFQLLFCDGSVAPEALDRLSIMVRPVGVPRPTELLPDEPDEQAWESGEWLPNVRLVHSRLLWVMQRVADAFPWRTIYVYSGYRPIDEATEGPPKPGSHQSRHASARAVDIHVMGVPNGELFKLCRKLVDVGCGFYPNSKFVHMDVRPGTGHPFWIDASGPGEPSNYVDSWPGIVERGGLAWDTRKMLDTSSSCEDDGTHNKKR